MNAAAHEAFENAKALATAGDPDGAAILLNQAISLDREHADSWNLLAILALQAEKHADAVRMASDAVRIAPAVAEHRYTLGRAYKAGGQLENAVLHYREAVRLNPDHVQAHVSLGVALRALGLLDDAIASYRRALKLDPVNEEARKNLGNALFQGGDALLEQRRAGDALARLEAAALLLPDRAQVHYRLGCALQDLDRVDEALTHYEIAIRLQPGHRDALADAGFLAASIGWVERAEPLFRRVLATRPSDAVFLSAKLMLPAIQRSNASIAETRRRYEDALDGLLAMQFNVPDPFLIQSMNTFFLAYHGQCNRHLQAKLAQLFLRACPDLAWCAPHCAKPEAHSGRIKVGFISRFLRHHSIGKVVSGLVAELSRERFETHSLFIPPLVEDDTSRFIREKSEHWIVLDDSLPRARERIAALQLDVLFYQDIGMEPFSYYLAFSRLAPVQCVSYGHPDTTGIPNMDYYISNDLYEPADGSEHYSETLFLMRDLATLAYYYRPLMPAEGKSRADFGIGEEEIFYLCPQSLFKIHPEFDLLAAGILRRDPRAKLAFVHSNAIWNEQILRRFENAMPDVIGRIVFLPRQGSRDYLRMLAAADVILDTIHFNGMNTSLEAFSVGTPVVTLPKSLQRGRFTQAMYLKMGIRECIAKDEEDYINIAVRLGADRGLRDKLRRKILERCHVLFEDRRAVREFERFFEHAVGHARTTRRE